MGWISTACTDVNSMVPSSPILRRIISIITRPWNDTSRARGSSFQITWRKAPRPGGFAVTNGDDPKGETIVEGIPVPVIRYGLNPSCEVRADQERLTLEGLSCRIQTPRGPLTVQSKLIGSYNLYNILAACP